MTAWTIAKVHVHHPEHVWYAQINNTETCYESRAKTNQDWLHSIYNICPMLLRSGPAFTSVIDIENTTQSASDYDPQQSSNIVRVNVSEVAIIIMWY